MDIIVSTSVGKATSATVKVGENQFIGVMSFLTWESEKKSREITRQKKLLKEQRNLLQSSDPEWPALIIETAAIAKPVVKDNTKQFPSTTTSLAIESAHNDTNRNLAIPNEVSVGTTNQYMGLADVISMEDSVVYSWSFKDLHTVLSMEPRVGVVFEAIISEDLSKKMATSWREVGISNILFDMLTAI